MTEEHESQYNETWIQNELETKWTLTAPQVGAVLYADELVSAWSNINKTRKNFGLVIIGWVIDKSLGFFNQSFTAVTFQNCSFPDDIQMRGASFHTLRFFNCSFSVVELSHVEIRGQLEFKNPKSLDDKGINFHLEGTHVTQDVIFDLEQEWNSTFINLKHATVEGDLKLKSKVLVEKTSTAELIIDLTSSEINSDVLLVFDKNYRGIGIYCEHAIVSGAFKVSNDKTEKNDTSRPSNVRVVNERLKCRNYYLALNQAQDSSFVFNSNSIEVSNDFSLKLCSVEFEPGIVDDAGSINGIVSLSSAKIGGSCSTFLECNFLGSINFDNLLSDSLDLILIKLDEASSSHPRESFRIGTGLLLRRTKISRHFRLSFAEIRAKSIGIDMSSSSVGGEISIAGIPGSTSTIIGDLDFTNTIIHSGLRLSSVQVQGRSTFDGVHVGKNSKFVNCELSSGFRAVRSRFDQALHFDNFTIRDSSLNMMDATVQGELKLSKVIVGSESNSGSDIYFEKIHVGHDLWIESNSKIHGRLVLENSEIKNWLYVVDTFIGDLLDLQFATICRKFEFKNIEIHHKTSDDAVLANGLNVKGASSFINVNTMNGIVNFSRAKFDNDFEIRSISLNKLYMSRVEVLGELTIRDFITQSETSVANLEHAHVGILNDTPSSWSGFSSMILGTFSFDALARETLNSWGDIGHRIEWIERNSKDNSVTSFYHEPYEYLAKSLIVLGRESDAREVVYAKEKALAQFERSNSRGTIRGFFKGIGSFVLKWVTGYGQKPIRLFAALFVTYCLSFTVVVIAKSNNLMAPISPSIANHHVVKSNVCTTYYPCISDVLYPLEATLPVLDLHQSGLWEISSDTSLGSALSLIFGLLTLSGWGISLLAVASLTGIIDRNKI